MKTKINMNISYKELVSKIEKSGCVLERSNKHHVYSCYGAQCKIILPHHSRGDIVSPGIIRKVVNLLEGSYYGGNNRLRKT